MRIHSVSVAGSIVVLLLLTGGAAEAHEEGLLLAPKAFRAAVERVLPSVVTIEAYGSIANPVQPASRPATRAAVPARRPGAPGGRGGRRGGGISQPGEGPTTGLIVSAEGHIITSTYNFLRHQPIITVVLRDGSQHVAKLLGRDETRKLCLLKIEAGKALPVAPTVVRDRLKVGQWAISVGFGYDSDEPAVSAGIISATHRIGGRAVQTDANLSPANYGGPLIDIEGRVIGICVPLSPQSRDTFAGVEWYDSGIGFAVPLHGLDGLIQKMAQGLVVRPGVLGIRPSQENRPEGGVAIEAVQPNTPAAAAGLQKGDIILNVNGQSVSDAKSLADIMSTLAAGDEVRIVLKRGTEEKTVVVKLSEPPASS